MCPYGKVGDRLYIRESFRYAGSHFEDDRIIVEYKDGDILEKWMYTTEGGYAEKYWNEIERTIKKAGLPPIKSGDFSFDLEDGQYSINGNENPFKWKPSIHMPKIFSRLKLEITKIRVERLQDIKTEDIIAEGLSTNLREHEACVYLKNKWINLWEPLNKKRGYGWDNNPWVWVIEFKRLGE